MLPRRVKARRKQSSFGRTVRVTLNKEATMLNYYTAVSPDLSFRSFLPHIDLLTISLENLGRQNITTTVYLSLRHSLLAASKGTCDVLQIGSPVPTSRDVVASGRRPDWSRASPVGVQFYPVFASRSQSCPGLSQSGSSTGQIAIWSSQLHEFVFTN